MDNKNNSIGNRDFNDVLKYLAERNMGEWSPEKKVETHFSTTEHRIHYYHIRVILETLKSDGYAEFSRHDCSYKITSAGKKFLSEGGYK